MRHFVLPIDRLPDNATVKPLSRRLPLIDPFIILCALVLVFSCLTGVALTQDTRSQAGPLTHIEWNKTEGVKRYRLQVATDERFTDVILDVLVVGEVFETRELAPGRYIWRIAPSDNETGTFLPGVPFQVKRIVPKTQPSPTPTPRPTRVIPTATPTPKAPPRATPTPTPSPVAPDNAVSSISWFAATGNIARPVIVPSGNSMPNIVGVNEKGTVYALDGQRGVALWTAGPATGETLPNEKRFVPLVATGKDEVWIIVSMARVVQARNAQTGKIVWSSKIAGRPPWGLVIHRRTVPKLYLIGEGRTKLYVIDAATAQLDNQGDLDDAAGPPVFVPGTETSAVAIPTTNNALSLHKLDGDRIRSMQIGAAPTTPPIVVQSTRGPILLVGTKAGLAAFNAETFAPLGRVALEEQDYPSGILTAADIDGDSKLDVIFCTAQGRVIAIEVDDGKVKWSATVPNEATEAALVDLDQDGRPDILLPGKSKFALALSGADGSLIWESEEEVPANKSQKRSLAVARLSDGRVIIVGNDPAAGGLRAIEVKSIVRRPK